MRILTIDFFHAVRAATISCISASFSAPSAANASTFVAQAMPVRTPDCASAATAKMATHAHCRNNGKLRALLSPRGGIALPLYTGICIRAVLLWRNINCARNTFADGIWPCLLAPATKPRCLCECRKRRHLARVRGSTALVGIRQEKRSSAERSSQQSRRLITDTLPPRPDLVKQI